LLKINKVQIAGDTITCSMNVDEEETIEFGGRIVKLDFGTVSVVKREKIKLVVGVNEVLLSIMNYDTLLDGNYAVYLDTIFATEYAELRDVGPYKFRKVTNE
jgi:hypothetical protein